jgi:hypothetical protein
MQHRFTAYNSKRCLNPYPLDFYRGAFLLPGFGGVDRNKLFRDIGYKLRLSL